MQRGKMLSRVSASPVKRHLQPLFDSNQAVIIALFRVINRYVGNLPPMPTEMLTMRWRMPQRSKRVARLNFRNTTSLH
jgi:hypothetical protein